ncbi:carbohydrate ABC transporter permease [Candidatus Nomurabacteria bacterium]|nr:carbohydrate ABC transporter permease [Candidatus Nomurabacteria bacterium]
MHMIRKAHKKLNRSMGGDLLLYIVLIVFGAVMALPLIYAISNAFKPLDELWLFPPRFFVRNPTLKNFSDLFRIMSNTWVPFSRYIFNTLFVSVVGTAGHIILSSLCAFALAKHDFPGSKILFQIVVLALMFHAAVTVIPNFIIMSYLNWINTYKALIIPAFGSSLGLYLMKQFMEQMIPDSILESAKIDGSSEWRTFWTIVMPMVKPAWLTLIIFSFQSLWNMGTSILIQKEQLKPLNYALQQVLAGGIARAGAGSAATVMMMSLPILIFLFTQSNIVETMSTSGMKE